MGARCGQLVLPVPFGFIPKGSMLESLLQNLALIDSFLWGPWTMGFLGGVAVFFTVRSGFFQITGLGYIVRNTIGRLASDSVAATSHLMSPVQAAATSLAGTVGMGNMAGVATALSVGGPGAIFWMWLMAAFGMMLKTAEITLGVYYREQGADGRMLGGPQYAIRRGLGWTPLAVLFSAGMLINAVLAASLLQAHTVGRALLASYDLDPYLVTGSMAIITALVVLGGARRIGRFSERLVPIMTLAYLAGGLVVIAANFEALPGVMRSIFFHAFSASAGVGGVAGVAVSTAIKQGMARGMLSNEAGLGTAALTTNWSGITKPLSWRPWTAFTGNRVTKRVSNPPNLRGVTLTTGITPAEDGNPCSVA